MKYLITGGGTGGHIYPALAIANEIKSRDKEAQILYVGTHNSLEAELVPKEGFDFKGIRVKGMPRRFNKESFIAAKELLLGLLDARKIIKEFKPDMVVGTGGYVSGPLVFMAHKMGVKTLIHEQNAFPGITNKILSRYVDRVAITFEESKKYFKHPDRVFLTGNPIRGELLNINKEKVCEEFELNKDKALILSFGGSGGQKSLNDLMFNFIKEANKSEDLQVYHITGKRFYDMFINRIKEENIQLKDNIKIFPYFYQMPKIMNVTDLIITSAGAISLAEVAAVGIPSILIPKSYTAENHQEFNARAFENKGASIVVLEKELENYDFNNLLFKTIGDKDKLRDMGQKAKTLSEINATKLIYDLISYLFNNKI